MTINWRIAEITPKQATTWLASVRNKAKANRRQVNAYADEMLHGRWKLNGEPIILSDSSTVLSGRLRLMACVAAKVSFPSLVIEGVPEGAFESIDAVRRRTTADILTILKEPNGRALAA